MGVTAEQLKPIKKSFEQEYWRTKPHSEYVSGCGTSQVRFIPGIEKLVLRETETLDDVCLLVLFKAEPPKKIGRAHV